MARTIGTPLDEGVRQKAAGQLQPLLVDLVALSLAGKQLHWHVTGPQFKPVHEQLDEVVDTLRTAADDVAERSVALGVPVDGRPGTVAKDSQVPEAPEGWVDATDAVASFAAAVAGFVERGRAAIEALEEEPVTQDLVISVVQEVEKHLWMLQAQLPPAR